MPKNKKKNAKKLATLKKKLNVPDDIEGHKTAAAVAVG